jgi:hypothetical protein
MASKDLSLTGALVGALAGLAAEVTIQEITGQQITHGLLELLGAAAGLWRLDRRLYESLQQTLEQAQGEEGEDYQQVRRRIEELTRDLPELREILSSMVDAGIQAQKA